MSKINNMKDWAEELRRLQERLNQQWQQATAGLWHMSDDPKYRRIGKQVNGNASFIETINIES